VKDAGGAASLAILFGAADRFAWLGLVFLPWLDRVRVLEHGAKDYGSVCTAGERKGIATAEAVAVSLPLVSSRVAAVCRPRLLQCCQTHITSVLKLFLSLNF
jgi:hypothetical protein